MARSFIWAHSEGVGAYALGRIPYASALSTARGKKIENCHLCNDPVNNVYENLKPNGR